MSKILELAKRIASTGGLETKTTETISGTYDSAGQQRLLSHAYTIGANLTITNGELILSRLADNGTGMTVEFGSDVTLSGDGTLMLGDLGQGQPNQDFSASRITGELGSGVTIGGGVIFPAGHVVNTTKYDLEDLAVVVSTTYANNKDTTFVQWGSLSYDVVLKQANSKILISTYFTIGNYAGFIYFDMKVSGSASNNGWVAGPEDGSGADGMSASHRPSGEDKENMGISFLHEPGNNSVGTTLTYTPYSGAGAGVTLAVNNYADSYHLLEMKSHFIFQEIAV